MGKRKSTHETFETFKEALDYISTLDLKAGEEVRIHNLLGLCYTVEILRIK